MTPTKNVPLNAKTGAGGIDGCLQVHEINPALLADLNFSNEHQGKGLLSELFFQRFYSRPVEVGMDKCGIRIL